MGKYIVGIAVIIGLSISTYHFWSVANQKEKALSLEIEKNKIQVSNTMLSDVTILEFLHISSDFTYYYERKFKSGLLSDNVQAIYNWSYTFTYGFDLTGMEWDWCPKVIDEEKGIVQINAPEITQTNTNAPSPTVTKSFKKPASSDNIKKVSDEIMAIAQEKMKDIAKAHLSEPTTRTSLTNALSKHIHGIFNSLHGDNRPISEVVVNYGNTCD